jgi:hypothetical protein
MDRLVASQEPRGATRETSFSLERYDFERRGRTKAFIVTGLVAFTLFWLQTLPWLVSTGHLKPHRSPSSLPVPGSIAPRLSLLFDFLFLVALAYHGSRTFELAGMGLRTAKRDKIDMNTELAKRCRRAGLLTLVLAIGLDATENLRLWWLATQDQAAQLFLPVLTPVVWLLLVLGVVSLWAVTGWVWWNIKRHNNLDRMRIRGESKRAAERRTVVLPEPRGTIITCSGGGIRSTAFCLGGLQVLADENIYQDARAVVGVSGGGYIAAAMHIVRSRANFEELDPQAFSDSSPEEAWLRRNTRYLLESVRVAALGGLSLMFGMVVNLFLVGSVMLYIAWWLGWFYSVSGGLTGWDTANASSVVYNDAWSAVTWTVWLAPAGLAVFMVEDALDRLFKVPRLLRSGSREASVLLLALGAVSLLVFYAIPAILVSAHDYAAGSGSAWARLLTAAGFIPHDVCKALLDQGHDACGSAAGPSVSRASLVSLGAIVTAAVTVLRSARRFLPDAATAPQDAGAFRKALDSLFVRLLPWASLIVIALLTVTLLLRWTTTLVADPTLLGHWGWFYGVAVGFLLLKVSTDANRTSLHYFYRERLSKAFVLERANAGVEPVPYSDPLRFSNTKPPNTVVHPGATARTGGPELIACASANASDNDVVPADRNCVPYSFGHNVIGLSGELFPPEARTNTRLFEFNADQGYRVATVPAAMAMSGAAFSPLAGRYTKRLAPYRVVMALANARLGVWLPNPLWIEDDAVFRRLVKLREGDEVVKYLMEVAPKVSFNDLAARDLVWLQSLLRVTPVSEEVPTALDEVLATALERELGKTRGSAAPDMESAKSRKTQDVVKAVWRNVMWRPGAFHLAKEAFGQTSIYDRYLYITDGGHYDNLGLVEALRCRPREVYVLDASSDPPDTFNTLGQAIATARMDLGCEVELNPRLLQRGKNAEPPLASYGIGKVTYADGAETDLFFLKAMVTQTLPWDVEAYAKEHHTFPRTATSNQLYGEFDLEAYRVLGREGARALLGHIRNQTEDCRIRWASGSAHAGHDTVAMS